MRYVVLVPWKFQTSSPARQLCEDFFSRMDRKVTIELVQPRSQPENESEASDFLKKEVTKAKEQGCLIICLDERGCEYTSVQFSDWLAKKELQSPRGLCFIVGGAYGLPKLLGELKGGIELISISQMTLSHELALTILAEQLYRAHCIRVGHPYHHGNVSELAKFLKK